MNVRECINKCRQKTLVSIARLIELKQYNMAMYRYNMLNLYDKGYIDDPTVFDRKLILQNLLDLKVKGLANSEGFVELSYEWVGYLNSLSVNNSASEFLSLLQDALKYKKYSNELDVLYEEFYTSKYVKLPISMKGSKIFVPGIEASKGILSVFVKSDETLKTVELNRYFWEYGMELLEIPEEDWSENGLFCKWMSHEDEVKYLELIFEGKIIPNGKYGDVLKEWLLNHRWSKNEENVVAHGGLLGYIHSTSHYKVYNMYKRLVKELEESGENVLCVLGLNIYVVKKIVNYKIPISPFAVICRDGVDTLVTSHNALSGYCGEAYPSDYLQSEGVNFLGLPINIVDEDLDELILYDREQTDMKEETWFKANNVDFIYENMRMRNPYKKYINNLFYSLFDIYRKSQGGGVHSLSLESYSLKEIQQAKKKVIQAIIKQEGV